MEHCPQCGADLECFELLDTLREPKSIGWHTKHQKRERNAFSLKAEWFMLASLLVLLLGLVAIGNHLDMRIDQQAARLAEMEAIANHRKSSGEFARYVAAMEKRILELEEENFQKRIDTLEHQRTVVSRRIEAALATYRASDNSRSKP